jgi:hypothetical protein
VDQAQVEALIGRLHRQGWDQGSHLLDRTDLFLASVRQPTTEEGERIASQSQGSPLSLVHEFVTGGPGMVVVSQRCDIVAHPNKEPLCEAVPLVIWPDTQQLPRPNSSRHFVIDHRQRIVADQTRRLSFEKSLLPDRDARNLLPNQERWRNFRAWCARRYSRVAFPDDFVEVVGSALDAALKRVGEKCPESEALHSWRVFLEEQADAVEVALLVPYDELRGVSRAAVKTYVDRVVAQARALLPRMQERAVKRHGEQVRRFRLADHVVEAMDTVSLRDIHESEPINFDDLTYTGDEIRGQEPLEEHLR